MFGLTRWTEPRGINRLRQDVDDLFDRFFNQEDWMPGRVTRSLRTFHRDLDDLFAGFFGGDWPAIGVSEGTHTFWPRAEMSLKDNEHILQLEVPEPEARAGAPAEGLTVGRRALDAKGVAQEVGPMVGRQVGEPVPGVDHAVQHANQYTPADAYAAADVDTFTHANPHACPDLNVDPIQYAEPYADRDVHLHADFHPDEHSDPHPDPGLELLSGGFRRRREHP